jgi:predicted DNA-binding transcriptional regulator YafY
MNLTRIRRLLRLIHLLQGGRAYNTESLALECEVSRRTIFRDLGLLREVGVPLVYDELHQGYHVPGTYFLPPTNFTPQEAMALIVLCHDVGRRVAAGQPPRLETQDRDHRSRLYNLNAPTPTPNSQRSSPKPQSPIPNL